MEIIREQLEQTVYQLAKQISCKGWALEMEYQLLKNWRAQSLLKLAKTGKSWFMRCLIGFVIFLSATKKELAGWMIDRIEGGRDVLRR